MAKLSRLRCGRSGELRRRLQPVMVILVLPLALGACATLEEVMKPPEPTTADAAALAPPAPTGPVALAPKLTGAAPNPVRVAAAKPIAAAPAKAPASTPIAAVPLPPPPAAKPAAALPPAPVAPAKPATPAPAAVAAPLPAASKEAPPVRPAVAETTIAVAAAAPGGPPAARPNLAAGKETACPAGTFGMWSKPDVIGQPVYICRSLTPPR